MKTMNRVQGEAPKHGRAILALLDKKGWSVGRAAREAGLTYKTLRAAIMTAKPRALGARTVELLATIGVTREMLNLPTD